MHGYMLYHVELEQWGIALSALHVLVKYEVWHNNNYSVAVVATVNYNIDIMTKIIGCGSRADDIFHLRFRLEQDVGDANTVK